MSDYTPDWIHIYSGWWHFIPPGITLIAVLAIALLAVHRRRLFPCMPRWFPVLALSLLIPATLFLLFMALSRNAWSIHAIDHVANGNSQSALRGEVGQMTDLVLPTDCAVDASIVMGWREYRHWYGIRGASQAIRSQVLKLGYAESNRGDDIIGEPFPEPISRWFAETKFQPSVLFRRDAGNVLNWIAIDTTRDLVFVTGADY